MHLLVLLLLQAETAPRLDVAYPSHSLPASIELTATCWCSASLGCCVSFVAFSIVSMLHRPTRWMPVTFLLEQNRRGAIDSLLKQNISSERRRENCNDHDSRWRETNWESLFPSNKIPVRNSAFHHSNQGAGIFKTASGLSVLPSFRAWKQERKQKCLFPTYFWSQSVF